MHPFRLYKLVFCGLKSNILTMAWPGPVYLSRLPFFDLF